MPSRAIQRNIAALFLGALFFCAVSFAQDDGNSTDSLRTRQFESAQAISEVEHKPAETETLQIAPELNQALKMCPPNTSFFILFNSFEAFRDKYERRVIKRFRETIELRAWSGIGFYSTLIASYEWSGIPLMALYKKVWGGLLIGRSEYPDGHGWFMLAEKNPNDPGNASHVREIFKNPLKFSDSGSELQDLIIASSDPDSLATIHTMRAFPRSHYEVMPHIQAADALYSSENIYQFQLRSDASNQWLPGFEGVIQGYTNWGIWGIHHQIEVREKGKELLNSLLADDDIFRSFNLLPRRIFATSAIRLRSSSEAYRALLSSDHPLHRLIPQAADFLILQQEESQLDLDKMFFSHLGGEWNFTTLPGDEGITAFLLIVEAPNPTAIETFFDVLSHSSKNWEQSSLEVDPKIQGYSYYARKYYLTNTESFLILSNQLNTLMDTLKTIESKDTLAQSTLFKEAEKRLVARGVFFSIYHSLACLTQMTVDCAGMPLNQKGYFAMQVPEEIYRSSDVRLPGRSIPPTVFARTDMIGCARLQRDRGVFRAEVYSATGFGPLEFTLASLFRPWMDTRLYTKLQDVYEKLNLLANAVRQYTQEKKELPKFRSVTAAEKETFEMYPPNQLDPYSGETLIDPFSETGRPLVYYSTGEAWIIISRGPDRDLDLRLQDDFKSDQQNPLQDAQDRIYSPATSLSGNGDIIIGGKM